jgi:1,2-dihydroxy-3-keto-5-methylthiopentene dioxygenase
MKANWLEGADVGAAIAPEILVADGIPYEFADPRPEAYQGVLDRYRDLRGYVTQDEVALSPATPGLDALCDQFKGEHFHDDDEVRFVLEGAGIFDIRSQDDRWMRVEVGPGDLIIVPAGRFHRFFLTESKQIRCVRLFKDPSGWTAKYRPAA